MNGNIRKIPKNRMSPRASVILRIRATLLLILLSMFDGSLYVFMPVTAVIAAVLILAAYFTAVVLLLPMYCKKYFYILDRDKITVNRGILIHDKTEVSLAAVQYCIIYAGPVQRLFGVCSIRMMMAGTSVTVRELPLKAAEKIKNLAEYDTL